MAKKINIEGIDIQAAVANIQQQMASDANLSPAFKAAIELLCLLVTLLANRLGLNSQNSSKPPSSDTQKKPKSPSDSNKKPGGQPGHKGTTLMLADEPDEVRNLSIDRRTLPEGNYTDDGYEKRQVVDIEFIRVITEYRAQILVNEQGRRFVAIFPDDVDRPIQYGNTIKAHAVYLSQFQLLPYARIADYFRDQVGIPLSAGSLVNFNREADKHLDRQAVTQKIHQHLRASTVMHADETGINVGGKTHWLHVASTPLWTAYHAHSKRGREAIDAAGIIPGFEGTLCHDHWKPYYAYERCSHALCNAHHLRELERAWEQDGMAWAKRMQDFLLALHQVVNQQGGCLKPIEAEKYRKEYRGILAAGDTHCPAPDEGLRKKGQRGRLKRSKARALLERLRAFEDDTLRFMVEVDVPFTNNLGENDIRMTKVQQKISGCFRSLEGANTFCAVRGYISTCRKHGVSASRALVGLFEKNLPSFFYGDAE